MGSVLEGWPSIETETGSAGNWVSAPGGAGVRFYSVTELLSGRLYFARFVTARFCFDRHNLPE